jgi:hypothetical protein
VVHEVDGHAGGCARWDYHLSGIVLEDHRLSRCHMADASGGAVA